MGSNVLFRIELHYPESLNLMGVVTVTRNGDIHMSRALQRLPLDEQAIIETAMQDLYETIYDDN